MILPLLLAATAPQPGQLKSFKDWAVGCDNVRTCTLASLGPQDGDFPAVTMAATRDAGPGGGWSLEFDEPEAGGEPLAGPVAVAVDGRRYAIAPNGLAGPRAARLVAAMANGRGLAVLARDGRALATISLAGAAAALRYVDAAQGRAGGVTAVVARGPAPARAVPAAPALPVVAVPRAGERPPRSLSAAEAARLIGDGNARCDYANGPVKPAAYRLDPAHSLVLVEHPCGNGAYNLFTSVIVVDERGRAAPARFDAAVGMSEDTTNELTNASWDADGRQLGEYVKARGLGDCGGSSSFAWDGGRFRLIEQTAMGECRGNRSFVTIWRARAVR